MGVQIHNGVQVGQGVILAAPGQGCCCKVTCLYVHPLNACCNDAATNLVICEGIAAVTVLIGNVCYHVDTKTLISLEDALADGKQLVTTNATGSNAYCFSADMCKDHYLVAEMYCGNGITPNWGYFGPCPTPTPPTPPNHWFQFQGKWWFVTGVTSINKCPDPVWPEAGGPEVILGGCLTEFTTPPRICCNSWQEDNYGARHSDEIPMCLQVSGMSFSTSSCGTVGTVWDGRLICSNDGYGISQSSDACGGNGVAILPGTNCALYNRSIVWWDWSLQVWHLDLTLGGYYWTGDGGTDPTDPTGTYTFVARYGLTTPAHGGPNTLTVTAV